MKKLLTTACLCSLFALTTACTASEADCEKLGDKVVELAVKEAKDLPEDLVRAAAEQQKKSVIEQCKADLPLKSEMDCALKAESVADLDKC